MQRYTLAYDAQSGSRFIVGSELGEYVTYSDYSDAQARIELLEKALRACEKEMRGCEVLIKSETWRAAFGRAWGQAILALSDERQALSPK